MGSGSSHQARDLGLGDVLLGAGLLGRESLLFFRLSLIVGGLTVTWWSARHWSLDRSFALAVALSALLAPVLWPNYLVLPLLGALIWLGAEPKRRAADLAFLAAYIWLTASLLAGWGGLAWLSLLPIVWMFKNQSALELKPSEC